MHRPWQYLLPGLILIAGHPVGAQPPSEPLPEKDPLVFLHKSLEKYDQNGVKSYTCTFVKQERIDGRLQPREVIRAAFRESPHSVFFQWVEGQRLASRVLYVEGANNDKMLAHPSGPLASRIA